MVYECREEENLSSEELKTTTDKLLKMENMDRVGEDFKVTVKMYRKNFNGEKRSKFHKK